MGDELTRKLEAIGQAVEDARTYEHEHGLTSRDTRKLPPALLRVLRRWQSFAELAERAHACHRENGDTALMASANVEFVRSIVEAWERGDYSSAEWAHPGIEFVIVEGPDPGSETGLVGMREVWREFLKAWDGWRVFAEEYRELDGERVLVLVHTKGRSKTSGLEVGQVGKRGGTCLFHVRSGKVTRLVVYYDFAGLAPEADP